MTEWKCLECLKIEGDEEELEKKKPNRLFHIWSSLEKIMPFKLPSLPEKLCWEVEKIKGTIKIVAACHHCGKLLCQQHAILILDDAFSMDEDQIRKLIPNWLNQSVELKTNPKFRVLEKNILSYLVELNPSYISQLKQKAYHCEDCWRERHLLSAYKEGSII